MKRILYLTFYFRPDLCAGSFRNSPLVDELIRQTKDKEIQIDVFTTSPNRYSTFRKDYLETEIIDNATITRIEVPPHQSGIKDQAGSFRTYFFETLRRTQKQEYDLVFASSSRFFTSYLGYRIAKKNKTPLYLDTRDLFSETLANITKKWYLKNIISPIIATREKKVFQYASHINLISEGFKESFSFLNSTTFSSYTHGVDPVFKKARGHSPTKKNKSIKEILYAGNIGEGQGLHKIIPEAAKQLEGSYTFKIIGDGGARQKLEERLLELDIQNVKVKEPVTRKELVEKYRNADILFIHLNDYDIFEKVLPSKIFELAVIEKPILAGVKGFARRFLLENINYAFVFEPGNVEELVSKIHLMEKEGLQNLTYDSTKFAEKYDRETINRQMVNSILSYL